MAITHINLTFPNGATQNGSSVLISIRNHQIEMIASALAENNLLPGWAMTTSGGTAAEPAQRLYSNGVYRVKCSLTWSGGHIATNAVEWSDNSGSSYDDVGTITYTRDGSGNLTASQFSAA